MREARACFSGKRPKHRIEHEWRQLGIHGRQAANSRGFAGHSWTLAGPSRGNSRAWVGQSAGITGHSWAAAAPFAGIRWASRSRQSPTSREFGGHYTPRGT